MKKNLLAGMVGIASTATLFAQGHIIISNYLTPPYNQVVLWTPETPWLPLKALNDTSVPIQVWYGEGVITDPSLLVQGGVTHVEPLMGTYDPGLGYGPGGYFDLVDQRLPTWQPGDVFTFQLRAFPPYEPGMFTTRLWTEQGQISPLDNAGRIAATVPAWVPVPEPSVLLLAGMGTIGMLFGLRRRETEMKQKGRPN